MGAQAVRLSNVDINNALENKDFEVLFQPIFDLGNGALARMETFVRWRHPTLGVLPPGAFISFFESQGRMGELTRYILSAALDSYGDWRGPCAPGFSVNLSLADLADEAFAEHLTSLLGAEEFPADLITLECPMPPVDSDLEGMIDRFAKLRETGARLAIEVRGRASEFLRTIDPFPFDEIKTGGSSILRFARTVRGPGLSAISDLLDIAKRANAVTTAVGVEDQASLSALRGLGFTAAQGNHLAKVGLLSEFRPARVNHVRELLELPALKGDDLSALFRTSAPTLDAAAPPETDETTPPVVGAEKAAADNTTNAEATQSGQTDEEKEAFVARARKKAKAIALAKRAKARDARKAAAIKRAKAKVARGNNSPDDSSVIDVDTEDPRELQDRIAQEFAGTAPASDKPQPSDETSEIDVGFDAPSGKAATDIAGSDIIDDTGVDFDAASELDGVTAEGEPTTSTEDADTTPDEPARQQNFQLKMPIGAAPVYFKPGMNVQSALRSYGREQDDAAAPPPSTVSDAPVPDISFTDDSEPPEEPTKTAPSPLHGAADGNHDTPQDDQPDDVANDAIHAAAIAEAPRRKRQKNFLARKYKVVPTHFWPKSWRRIVRQRRPDNDQAADG